MEKTYKFNRKDFDEDGFNKNNNEFFLDLIHKWEEDFNNSYILFYANHIFANHSTMTLINNCWDDNTNYDCGMDSDIDFDTNIEIGMHRKVRTICAIGSELKGNKDEQIFLIKDDNIGDGIIIYEYISDDDETSDIKPELPVEKEVFIN